MRELESQARPVPQKWTCQSVSYIARGLLELTILIVVERIGLHSLHHHEDTCGKPRSELQARVMCFSLELYELYERN